LHDSESGSHDFTIIVKAPATASEGKPEHAENRISTHKFILAARSPVLRAMLSSGMQEANADEMEITGYAVDAVSAFVRFLYCDVCAEEALKEHAWELIAMADKYDVAALRFVCETYLAEHLLPGNAVTTLQRADLHNAPVLKRKALEYIAQHKTALSENPAVLDGMSYELLREVVLAQAK
jgi:speckle-type POZ protein